MDYTEETFDKVMDLNVKGVFNTTRVAAECMVEMCIRDSFCSIYECKKAILKVELQDYS